MLLLFAPPLVRSQNSPDILWLRKTNSDRINAIIFAPDGQRLISGSSDRLIDFWFLNGNHQTTLNKLATPVHESSIEGLAMSPDSSRLVSVNYQTVKLWQFGSTLTVKNLTNHTDWVVGASFSPRGDLFATASFDTTVRIWRAADGAPLRVLAGQGGLVRAVAFSPDGDWLASSGGGDKKVRLWRTSDWTVTRLFSGHTDDSYSLAYSPDGTMVASGGYDRTARIWRVSDGALLQTFTGNGNVYGVAFSPDSRYLVFSDGEGNTLRVARIADGQLARVYTDEVDNVQAVAVSKDGLIGYGRADKAVVLARLELAPSQPRILSPEWSGTGFRCTIAGAVGDDFMVQYSADLRTWVPVLTNRFQTDTFQFSQTVPANSPRRFYRAVAF
jgi:WD40 repeat protein